MGEQGPNAGKWDNTDIIQEILALRTEMAKLLGFDSYAESSLATKMAESPQQVIDFLRDLAAKSKPQAQQDLDEVKQFASDKHNVTELQPGMCLTTAKSSNRKNTQFLMRCCAHTFRKTRSCQACSK